MSEAKGSTKNTIQWYKKENQTNLASDDK